MIFVGVHHFLPNNQYVSPASAAGSNAGMILSRTPVCTDKDTLPVENFNGVYTFTTVATIVPTTMSPMTEIASVKILSRSLNEVINLVPEE